MTNLFIGLFSRHPLLRPHSISIHQLGYSIHSIEPSFRAGGSTINPEAIACSLASRHTLLTEWTAASSLSYEKERQIHRYLSVNSNDLARNAKVSLDACHTYSLWVTVPPSSLSQFEAIIDASNSNRLLLCSFDRIITGEYCIEFHLGNICDSDLACILKRTMKFKRVPEGYLPIPLDNLRDKRLADGVVQQIITFLIKKKYEFSIEEICEEMIGIWNYFQNDKKTAIRRAVRRVMSNLSRQTYCQAWLSYNSPNWQVHDFSKAKLDKFIQAVQPDALVSDESATTGESVSV